MALFVAAFLFVAFGKRPHQSRRNVIHPDPRDATTTLSPNPSESNPCGFVLYKQCNSTWANEPLGTSQTNTICSAGCAMSSTAMIVSTFNGRTYQWNPDTLNNYLISHDGYIDNDLIVWAAVEPLGPVFVQETHITEQDLISSIPNCTNAFIANVRNGEHWVLLTAYAGNGIFYVNDPGFSTTQYAYSGMGNIVQYYTNVTNSNTL